MTVPTLVVTPSAALDAYRRVGSASDVQDTVPGGGLGAGQAGGDGFAGVLGRTLQDAITSGQDADRAATDAVMSGGDVTHVVTAVSKAQVALQEVVTIRDKVVAAYQEIMRMSI